jgi:hypothetical protein
LDFLHLGWAPASPHCGLSHFMTICYLGFETEICVKRKFLLGKSFNFQNPKILQLVLNKQTETIISVQTLALINNENYPTTFRVSFPLFLDEEKELHNLPKGAQHL